MNLTEHHHQYLCRAPGRLFLHGDPCSITGTFSSGVCHRIFLKATPTIARSAITNYCSPNRQNPVDRGTITSGTVASTRARRRKDNPHGSVVVTHVRVEFRICEENANLLHHQRYATKNEECKSCRNESERSSSKLSWRAVRFREL